MISLDKYYRFAAEDVECIETSGVPGAQHPYTLTVCLKSGKKCRVDYSDLKARDNEARRIAIQIEREKRADMERIQHELYLVRSVVERIDKRQLRMWRLLRNLPGVTGEEEIKQ